MEARYAELLKNEKFIEAVADLLIAEMLPVKSLTLKQKYNWEQRWKRITSAAEREYAATLSAYFKRMEEALLGNVRGIKGDLPGHPFRGNQYTEGYGSFHDDAAKLGWDIRYKPRNFIDNIAHEKDSAIPGHVVVSAFADHDDRVLYLPVSASERAIRRYAYHELAHIEIAQDDSLQEMGQNILDNVREVLAGNASAYDLGLAQQTAEHMKPYLHMDMNEASLIEEAYAADVGFQKYNAWRRENSKKSITKYNFSNTDWKFDIPFWQEMLQEYSGEFVKDMYEQIGGEVFKYLKYVSGDPRIVGAFDVEDPNVQKFIEDYSYKFAEDIIDTTVEDIREVISQGQEEGLDMREIGKLVQDKFDTYIGPRAELIARTETIRSSNYAAIESYKQSGVVTKKEWLVTEDDRLCVFCAAMQGVQIDLDVDFFDFEEEFKPVEGDDSLVMEFDYEAIGGPPLHPNCFLPGQRLISPGGFVTGLAAWYDGDAVEFTFANGTRLAVTPNHLLLTQRGMCAAKLLREGDEVLYYADFDGVVRSYPYNNGQPSVVEKIIDAFPKAFGMATSSVPVSSKHLHGDGKFVKRNVRIVHPHSLLRRAGEPRITKKLYQPDLFGTDPKLFGLSGFGDFAAVLKRMARTTDSFVGGRRKTAPFFSSRLLHSGVHGSTSISGSDPKFNQASADCWSANSEVFSDSFLRNTGVIHPLKITKIDVFSYHGYVYDLQTFSSLCIANGVLSSNCRCTLIPVVNEEYLREEEPEEKRGLAVVLKGGVGSGEHEGHPFRGNQWTDREGGGTVPSEGTRYRIDNDAQEWMAERGIDKDSLVGAMRSVPAEKMNLQIERHGLRGNTGIHIEAKWRSPGDAINSEMRVELLEKGAYFHIFQIDDRYREHGAAEKIMNAIEDTARKAGIPSIEMNADISIGQYAWARLGYDYKKEGTINIVRQMLHDYTMDKARSLGVKIKETELNKKLSQLKTAKDVAEFTLPGFDFRESEWRTQNMDVPEGMRLHLGKAFMLDKTGIGHGGWDAIKHLNKPKTKGGPGSGEGPGHPFRGNQYTDGVSSDEPPTPYRYVDEELKAKAEESLQELKPVLGGALNVEDFEETTVQRHVALLNKFSDKMLEHLRNVGCKWFIGNKPYPDLDDNGDVRGQIPRGWEHTGFTWDHVGGGYNTEKKTVTAGRGLGSSENLIGHETGHAVWNEVLNSSQRLDFKYIQEKYYDSLIPYYKQGGRRSDVGASELFAEAVASYIKHGEVVPSIGTTSNDCVRELNELLRSMGLRKS